MKSELNPDLVRNWGATAKFTHKMNKKNMYDNELTTAHLEGGSEKVISCALEPKGSMRSLPKKLLTKIHKD